MKFALAVGLAGSLLATMAFAQAWTPLDPSQAWINIASQAGWRVESVDVRPSGENEFQRIRARVGDDRVTFVVERSPTTIGIAEDDILIAQGSQGAMNKLFPMSGGETSGYRRFTGSDVVGASVDFDGGRCRGSLIGLKANSPPTTFGFVVTVLACGGRLDEVSAYLPRMEAVRPQRR